MQDGYAGYTDGFDVFLDDRLNAEQTLCTLQHELIHLELGHKGHQPEAVEMEVRYETARRLLPLDRIVGVCKGQKSLKVLAGELGVTQQVLMDRAATLTDKQAKTAGCWDCLKCPSIAARKRTLTKAQ